MGCVGRGGDGREGRRVGSLPIGAEMDDVGPLGDAAEVDGRDGRRLERKVGRVEREETLGDRRSGAVLAAWLLNESRGRDRDA